MGVLGGMDAHLNCRVSRGDDCSDNMGNLRSTAENAIRGQVLANTKPLYGYLFLLCVADTVAQFKAAHVATPLGCRTPLKEEGGTIAGVGGTQNR